MQYSDEVRWAGRPRLWRWGARGRSEDAAGKHSDCCVGWRSRLRHLLSCGDGQNSVGRRVTFSDSGRKLHGGSQTQQKTAPRRWVQGGSRAVQWMPDFSCVGLAWELLVSLTPVHHECGLCQFGPGRQVEPDLVKTAGVRSVGGHQWKHLAVHHASTRSHPLQVSIAVSASVPVAVGVINLKFQVATRLMIMRKGSFRPSRKDPRQQLTQRDSWWVRSPPTSPDSVAVIVSNPRCGCWGKPGTRSPWYMRYGAAGK